jgi:peptidoglycan/LPS O-acetylase OafA/YrhL
MPGSDRQNPQRFIIHSSRRLQELDGVRGLAIVSVLLWHFLVMPHVLDPAAPKPPGMIYLVRTLSLTWAGVDLFFALSGFLIAGILLDTKGAPFFLRGFYLRRIFRIYPIYWLVMALCFAIPLLADHLQLVAPPAVYAVLLQNFWMATSRSFGGDALGVTWSLSIEEQFYLVLPAIVLLLQRSSLSVLLALAVIGAPLTRFTVSAPPGSNWLAAYVLTICRADALALGALLAILARGHLKTGTVSASARVLLGASAVGVVALIANGDTIGSPVMNVAGYSVLALGAVSVIGLVVSNPQGLLGRAMQFRPLREAGTISYGLYLMHIPVLLLCRQYLGVASVPATWPAALYAFLIPALLSVALAALSWRVFERALVRTGHRLSAQHSQEAVIL